jgi:hypothetical protein
MLPDVSELTDFSPEKTQPLPKAPLRKQTMEERNVAKFQFHLLPKQISLHLLWCPAVSNSCTFWAVLSTRQVQFGWRLSIKQQTYFFDRLLWTQLDQRAIMETWKLDVPREENTNEQRHRGAPQQKECDGRSEDAILRGCQLFRRISISHQARISYVFVFEHQEVRLKVFSREIEMVSFPFLAISLAIQRVLPHRDTSQVILNMLVVEPHSVQECEITLEVHHLSLALFKPIGTSKEGCVVFDSVRRFV